MRPLYLSFSAFGPYAGRQELDFADLRGRNFFLIHGATGAGKTTILDAICFALYGDSSGNLRDGRTMRSNHAGLNMPTEVKFTFALGEEIYCAWRSPEQERAKKRGEGTTVSLADGAFYRIDGAEETLLASGYSNVTAKAEELLGFKSSQFRQVVLLPQGDFRRLLLANSLERQEIMQALFKTDLYKSIEENLKEKAKAIRQEREALVLKRDFILQELGVESAEALTKLLQEETKLCAEEKQTEKLLAAERKAMQQKLADDQLIASKFAQLAKARAEQDECEKLLPTVQAYRDLYRKAEQAASLADVEEQAEEAAALCAKSEKDVVLAAAQAEAAVNQAKQAEAVLKQEEAKMPEHDLVNKRLLALAALADKGVLLKEAITAEKSQTVLSEAAARRLETSEVVLAAAQEKEKNLREDLRAAEAEKGKEAQYRLELDGLCMMEKKWTQRRQLGEATKKAAAALAAANAALVAAEQAHEAKGTDVRRLQYLFMEGQAAILSRRLENGQPCPVCGSKAHPHPADGGQIIPDEAEVKAAEAAFEAAEKRRQEARQQAAACQTEKDTFINRLGDIDEALGGSAPDDGKRKEEIASLKQRLVKVAACVKEAVKFERLADAAAKEAEKAASDLEDARKAWQTAENARQAAVAVVRERREALPEQYRDPAVLLNDERALRESLARLKEQLAAARQAWQRVNDEKTMRAANHRHCLMQWKESKARRQEAQEKLTERLAQAGFSSMEAYQAAKRKPDFLISLAERIANFEERIIAAKKALQAAVQATEGHACPDVDCSRKALMAKEEAYNAAFARLCRREDEIAKRREKEKRLKVWDRQIDEINARYAVMGTLAEVANGVNSRGMTFQRFVLKSLLQDVIAASNLRLRRMSRGQYMLQSTEDRARKNAAGGLEIEVFDHYTGYARPVATLSGGETFLASLALALGLADVVQNYAGGIHLDTIFVDEGFGTLDPESLDTAIKALIDLQKGGRLVGIISHVPELQERVDARLEVRKGKSGSHAAFVVS